eukprot:scaffold43092_cov26-Tisochrysis_lutea.AAC.3
MMSALCSMALSRVTQFIARSTKHARVTHVIRPDTPMMSALCSMALSRIVSQGTITPMSTT